MKTKRTRDKSLMEITVNGRQEQTRKNITLMEFIIGKGLEPGSIIVELNKEVVKKERLEDILIRESDVIEVLRLVGGG